MRTAVIENQKLTDTLAIIPPPEVIAARLTTVENERRILRRLLDVAIDARAEQKRRSDTGCGGPLNS